MYSQADVRTGRNAKRGLVRAWPSVIVGTEKVFAGSGWAR